MNCEVMIYTDGACKGNPGKGGWGAIMIYKDTTKELWGGETNTTNNRMELTAVIEALKHLKKPCDLCIVTDSQYVIKGINDWMVGWKKNGWKSSSKAPVKNVDLWQALDQILVTHVVKWKWVKGHSGDPLNERADFLANRGVIEHEQ